MNAWSNFFVAMAGAAAALAGLIFVGVSISLTRILAVPALPGRASESLILLLTVLIISSLCLVPGQPGYLMGIEFLAMGILVWSITLKIDLGILSKTEASYKKHSRQNILFSQLAVLPYIVAGVVTIIHGMSGIYWLIPAIVFSFIKAVLDAWVLLVEIHR